MYGCFKVSCYYLIHQMVLLHALQLFYLNMNFIRRDSNTKGRHLHWRITKNIFKGHWQTHGDSDFLHATTWNTSFISEYDSQKTHTSLKKMKISMENNRLLFFSRSTYIAYCMQKLADNFNLQYNIINNELYDTKLFIHCLVICLHYLLCIPIKNWDEDTY
jgi:hypothetical protein